MQNVNKRKLARSKWESQGGSISALLCIEDRIREPGVMALAPSGQEVAMPGCVGGEAAGWESWLGLHMDVVTGQWEAGVGSVSRL